MPEDDNVETPLQIQGMRPMPEEKPLQAAEQQVVPIDEPAVAKKRGPRRQKAIATTPKRGRPTKTTSSVDTASRGPVKAKNTRGRQAKSAAGQKSATEMSIIDELAELAQLDKENRQLRKTLGDKLRRENADLRKRLRLE